MAIDKVGLIASAKRKIALHFVSKAIDEAQEGEYGPEVKSMLEKIKLHKDKIKLAGVFIAGGLTALNYNSAAGIVNAIISMLLN